MSEENEAAIVSPRETTMSAGREMLERRAMNALGSKLEAMPWESCRRLGAYLGLAYFASGRRRHELAVTNVQLALGLNHAQSTRIARRAAQNWAMTLCEFLHLPGASAGELRDYVHLDGLEHLHCALQGGRGAIILTAHLGNWELLMARLAQEFFITGIVRPLNNGVWSEHMMNVRSGVGLKMISKHAGARPAFKILRSGGALCILPDRHAGSSGARLPFFGRPTNFETSPARLAVISGAPIVPVFGVRETPWLSRGRIQGRVLPPFFVRAGGRCEREVATIEGTRQVIACLENVVRVRPDQWTWMMRRWRDQDTLMPQSSASDQ